MKKAGPEQEGGRKRQKRATAVDDVNCVLCAEGESALVVRVRVWLREMDVVGACVEGGWEERRMESGLVPLGPGRK